MQAAGNQARMIVSRDKNHRSYSHQTGCVEILANIFKRSDNQKYARRNFERLSRERKERNKGPRLNKAIGNVTSAQSKVKRIIQKI